MKSPTHRTSRPRRLLTERELNAKAFMAIVQSSPDITEDERQRSLRALRLVLNSARREARRGAAV